MAVLSQRVRYIASFEGLSSISDRQNHSRFWLSQWLCRWSVFRWRQQVPTGRQGRHIFPKRWHLYQTTRSHIPQYSNLKIIPIRSVYCACVISHCAVLSCLVCNCCWLAVCIVVVVVLCVLLSSYVYLLYYVCIAVFTLDAGLLARSQYSEGPATGHLDTGFSWFPCA